MTAAALAGLALCGLVSGVFLERVRVELIRRRIALLPAVDMVAAAADDDDPGRHRMHPVSHRR